MVRYPAFRKELLALLHEDQAEVRQAALHHGSPQDFNTAARNRMRRVYEILAAIKEPSVENVGTDGSQAISVIALHAKLADMKHILKQFSVCYAKNPKSVYAEAIPSLTDRVQVLEGNRQIFGTQWYLGEDDNFYLFPVENFKEMNTRRSVHGLGKSHRAISLASPDAKKPRANRVDTIESDQREPTSYEYKRFTEGQI